MGWRGQAAWSEGESRGLGQDGPWVPCGRRAQESALPGPDLPAPTPGRGPFAAGGRRDHSTSEERPVPACGRRGGEGGFRNPERAPVPRGPRAPSPGSPSFNAGDPARGSAGRWRWRPPQPCAPSLPRPSPLRPPGRPAPQARHSRAGPAPCFRWRRRRRRRRCRSASRAETPKSCGRGECGPGGGRRGGSRERAESRGLEPAPGGLGTPRPRPEKGERPGAPTGGSVGRAAVGREDERNRVGAVREAGREGEDGCGARAPSEVGSSREWLRGRPFQKGSTPGPARVSDCVTQCTAWDSPYKDPREGQGAFGQGWDMACSPPAPATAPWATAGRSALRVTGLWHTPKLEI